MSVNQGRAHMCLLLYSRSPHQAGLTVPCTTLEPGAHPWAPSGVDCVRVEVKLTKKGAAVLTNHSVKAPLYLFMV